MMTGFVIQDESLVWDFIAQCYMG